MLLNGHSGCNFVALADSGEKTLLRPLERRHRASSIMTPPKRPSARIKVTSFAGQVVQLTTWLTWPQQLQARGEPRKSWFELDLVPAARQVAARACLCNAITR